MDASSSKCENIDEVTRDGLAEEVLETDKELETDLSSTAVATSALDYEDSKDEDAQEEYRQTKDPSSSKCEEIVESTGDGPAEEESETESSSSLSLSASDTEEFSDGEAADDESGINLIKAAIDDNVKIFDDPNLRNEDFFKKTLDKNNILHIAVRYERTKFLKAFFKKFYPINKKLLTEKDPHGNTPLHVAAQVEKENIVKLLCHYLKKSVQGGNESDEKKPWNESDEKPWRAKNLKGNTALHVALLCDNADVADFLVKMDPDLACIVNKREETPLHLAITHLDEFECKPMISVLLEKASSVASWRDAKGLTPLLRAAFLDPFVILEVTKKIIGVCPESTLMCDLSGNSFLHLLIYNKLLDVHPKEQGELYNYEEDLEDLISLKEIRVLKDLQDQDGNTPLHIAAYCENKRMVRSLQSTCSANSFITNNNGISARSVIQQKELLKEPRSMERKEFLSASEGNINTLLETMKTIGFDFLDSQDSATERNFLHLLMNTTAIHHIFSSLDNYSQFLEFIEETLFFFPHLVYQIDKSEDTPVHILVRNKDFCKSMEGLEPPATLWESRLFSELLSICVNAITRIESRGGIIKDEANNIALPWVKQNASGNTPLHEAIIANNKVLVLKLLGYSRESARFVNKHKETPLHLLASMKEFTVEEIMDMVNANPEALKLADNDGLTPISRALKAENQHMVVTLLQSVKNFSDIDGQTFWHFFLCPPAENFVKGLLQNEVVKYMLQQKDKNGNTAMHLAMKENRFAFVDNILETSERERQLSEGEEPESNQWLMDLLNVRDKNGLTPIIIALNAGNQNLATRLCRVNPEAAKKGDKNGKTIWHLLSKPPSYKSENVKELLKTEALRMVLKQKDKDGNTPLHLAMKEKCFAFVENILETLGRERQLSDGEEPESNQWLMDLLVILDKDGLTPIITALNADYQNLATRLCIVNPEAAKKGDKNGKTIWHLLSKHPSYKSENVKELLKTEALRKVLEQKDKDGNTPLHLAIKDKCLNFVKDLLEASGVEHESTEENSWPLGLLKIPNNDFEIPEDLLAELPALPEELEKIFLTNRKMRGIRSSWGIPRTQLQNYMSSMNVIAALQTTITFTAAFTVPGGLNQDIGTPILIGRLSFQLFMMSDIIAMCLSMMVLICLLWMVATDKRKSVMLQDFALTLLLLSFFATIFAFMEGVYATIYPVKPWMAITTLVLCSLLMLLLPRRVLTNVLLHFKYPTVRLFKKMFSRLCC